MHSLKSKMVALGHLISWIEGYSLPNFTSLNQLNSDHALKRLEN
ncbi:hypothetical protein EV08_0969 [Prochlorococcus marinus str. SS2]|nr:hypothetical protein EV04_1769 [Prochlorococcus marinus str. LG]KGG20386.1 hypothetical protein EV08_0969 [Prochlorococcus marinus str. SS2]